MFSKNKSNKNKTKHKIRMLNEHPNRWPNNHKE